MTARPLDYSTNRSSSDALSDFNRLQSHDGRADCEIADELMISCACEVFRHKGIIKRNFSRRALHAIVFNTTSNQLPCSSSHTATVVQADGICDIFNAPHNSSLPSRGSLLEKVCGRCDEASDQRYAFHAVDRDIGGTCMDQRTNNALHCIRHTLRIQRSLFAV